MSAIWGAISLDGCLIPEETKDIFRKAFYKCTIDRYEETDESGCYVGTGIQYFTTEAEHEVLPVKRQGAVFTADVILDNRQILIDHLRKKKITEGPQSTDGQILQDYYDTFGDVGLDDILGAYVAVKYEIDRPVVTIFSDAVGYRFVYYSFQNGLLLFSSLMEPLIQCMSGLQPNERWIGDYLGQNNLNVFTESEETPFCGIYRIAPAGLLRFTRAGIEKKYYWTPFQNVKKIRYASDKEYKEHFLSLYRECVTSVMRSGEETAMFLSGGYDSTSIAAFATEELKKRGKQLHAFTAVPFQKFYNDPDIDENTYMTDETEAVKLTAKKFGNVECNFLDLENIDLWEAHYTYQRICEIPYKSPENMLWLYEGMRQAREQHCRIMLGGMFGNGTVSLDNAAEYFCWLVQHGKWIRLWREICALNQREHYTRKSLLLTAIKDALHVNDGHTTKEELFQNSLIKRDYLEKSGALDRLLAYENLTDHARSNYSTFRNAFIDRSILRHYGEYMQHNSLYTGVIIRDPTRDRRMIEFVAGIPLDQFTHNGYRRRLISEYMKEYMPAHVLEENRQGRQSADEKQRLVAREEELKSRWIQIYTDHISDSRVDSAKAIRELEEHSFSEMEEIQLTRHYYVLTFLEYMDQIHENLSVL